jgi:hypothetical protein
MINWNFFFHDSDQLKHIYSELNSMEIATYMHCDSLWDIDA